MDIHCPTCREPYESYHLKHDEIFETDLAPSEQDNLSECGTPLTPSARAALERLGWRFKGESVLTFIRCPNCPPDASPVVRRLAQRRIAQIEALSEVLGGDEDGLQSALEDLEFFYD